MSRELFEKVRVNAVFFGVFWDFGWVLGPLCDTISKKELRDMGEYLALGR